jgi:hypothetical protein
LRGCWQLASLDEVVAGSIFKESFAESPVAADFPWVESRGNRQIANPENWFFGEIKMYRDKLGLLTFSLAILGFIVFVQTESVLLLAVGLTSVAILAFTNSRHIK